VKRKNGSAARLAIRDMKSPDGDIKFIIHVAAVSWAATAVPEARFISQILRKTRLLKALGLDLVTKCFNRCKALIKSDFLLPI
jgi:hypothetical protein